MGEIADRFYWAKELMQPRAEDHIIELGCGTGLLLSLLCPILDGGKIVAVDSSPAMIKKAASRNAKWEKEGRLQFVNSKIAELQCDANSFDIAVAFNVNVFFKSDLPAIQVISNILKPGGTMFVFYQPPFNTSIAFMAPVAKFIAQHQFKIIQTVCEKGLHFPAFCVQAKNNKMQ